MAAGDELRGAIEHLYVVFEPYHVQTLVGCPHCTSDEHGRYLASHPLKRLAPADLERYAFKAMTTWGTVQDFKHFLPRVLEIAAEGAFNQSVDVEVVFSKLEYGDWHQWPERERAAVTGYLRSLWLDLLSRYPHPLEADECLCGIGNAVGDMTFYLDASSAAKGCPAMLHLAEFVEANVGPVYRKRQTPILRNAFWEDRPAQARQVSEWLLDPARVDQVERAFFRCGGDESERLLSVAREQLELLRRVAENGRG